jgi:arylsulfatase A-like enzyme
MEHPRGITRVILVVLDGLRADATALFALPHLGMLARNGAATFAAHTVQPSITAAAMTSLFTGVSPQVHGIESDRFGLPRRADSLVLLPRLLQQHGLPVHVFLHAIPRAYRGVAARVGAYVGATIRCSGNSAAEILAQAAPVLDAERHGVQFLHWPDADRAGHAHGWTSPEYAAATRRLDDALGALVAMTGVRDDPSTLLIAFADHGGGGVRLRDHDSRHPLDTTIPIVLAGGQVATGELAPLTSLLDIPPTVAWALGLPVPAPYSGRALVEAFEFVPCPAPAFAVAGVRERAA